MSGLPGQLDPWKAADQKRYVRGTIALNKLQRVRDMLVAADGDVEFEFEFFYDDKHRPCLKGFVKATVQLECQRCLDAVNVGIDAQVLLCVVRGLDEAEQLPDEVDPLGLEQDRVCIQDLIEDEIILALPSVPMHEPDDGCAAAVEKQIIEQTQGEEVARDNPFQILEQLKKKIH